MSRNRKMRSGIKAREVPDVYAVAPHSRIAAEMSLVSSDRAETTNGHVCRKRVKNMFHRLHKCHETLELNVSSRHNVICNLKFMYLYVFYMLY